MTPGQDKEAGGFVYDAAAVPAQPGCYLMKDAAGRVIYVGKAKSLRARLRGYFNETDGRPTVRFLLRRLAAVEFMVTASEKEALLLEDSLVKAHKPKYNVRLKDDKTFLSLRLDPRERFPRITVVRRVRRDGARYFGPYHDSKAARQMLRQLGRVFPLRTCSDHVLENRSRPCIYHDMGRCAAPCTGLISPEAYAELAAQAVLALEGRGDELERRLLADIRRLAAALRFEEAAALRDRLAGLRGTLEKQRAVGGDGDRDVFGVHTRDRFAEVYALFYRGGRLLGGKAWSFERHDLPLDGLLESLLWQYYAAAPVIPREVLVPLALEGAGALAELLAERRGGAVRVLRPQRGDKAALVDLASRNARQSFEEKRLAESAARDTLELIRDTLRLPRAPRRIECFDISTHQGDKTVGSMAVFEDAAPAPARRRRFIVRTVAGQDDFGALREVLTRRYTRALAEDDLPDLVLIDGGRGQLAVARAVLDDLGLHGLPCASIAKSRPEDGARSPERFFLPNRANPVVPPQSGPVVRTLARLRDEAHRIAITHHRARRKKEALAGELLRVPGVGPKRMRALLAALGSLSGVRAASPEQLAAVPGFNEKLARQVWEWLQQTGVGGAPPVGAAEKGETS